MGRLYLSDRPSEEMMGGGAVARILERNGACANELRLMGVEREEMPANVGITGAG